MQKLWVLLLNGYKLYWYPKFYNHVNLFAYAKTLGTFIERFQSILVPKVYNHVIIFDDSKTLGTFIKWFRNMSAQTFNNKKIFKTGVILSINV